jgi:hypothetical protein
MYKELRYLSVNYLVNNQTRSSHVILTFPLDSKACHIALDIFLDINNLAVAKSLVIGNPFGKGLPFSLE